MSQWILGNLTDRLWKNRQFRHDGIAIALGHVAEQTGFAIMGVIEIAILDGVGSRRALQQHVKYGKNGQKRPAPASHFPNTVKCRHTVHKDLLSYHGLPGKGFQYGIRKTTA